MVRGRRPKIFYATQAGVAPPTFVFFANDAASVHFSYRRYLINALREGRIRGAVLEFPQQPVTGVFDRCAAGWHPITRSTIAALLEIKP